jgi:hypothetical protein
MTGCDTKRRGRWWCNGREGGLIHNNQQTVEVKVRVAKGEALSGDWIGMGGKQIIFIRTKIITFISYKI